MPGTPYCRMSDVAHVLASRLVMDEIRQYMQRYPTLEGTEGAIVNVTFSPNKR